MSMRLGIDLGGTKVNLGVLTEDGRIVQKHKFAVPAGIECKPLMELVAGECLSLLARCKIGIRDVCFAGMGVPGSVDSSQSIVLHAPNLHFVNAPCADLMESYCGLRPRLVQDSRAAAWGEKCFGEAKDSKLLVCITLGTGIGCGIVYNGAIFHGALGTAGEVGHIPVTGDGWACSCGRFGCMEAYASGTGIARMAAEHPDFAGQALASEQVFALALDGNTSAREIVHRAVNALGQALTAVINTLSPDALIFSGGMCTQRELLVDPLISYLRSHGYGLAVGDRLKIGVSSLGSDAPMIGAAMLDKAM
jgi:glucokinase